MQKKVVIIGASGQARVIADIVKSSGFELVYIKISFLETYFGIL